MPESTIEQRLVALGEAMTFPRAESLADDVVVALGGGRRRLRWALLAAAAVVLVVGAVVAALPESRHAVARWLGFEQLRIERVVRLPDVPPVEHGPSMTLAEAEVAVGVAPRVAVGLGDPVSVEAPGGRYVAVRYDDDGRGVLVATLPGRLDGGLFQKLVASGVVIDEITVEGRPAYWVTGATHVFMYVDADGDVAEARPADDTLVWQDGDVVVRVEGEVSLERALEIASTIREP